MRPSTIATLLSVALTIPVLARAQEPPAPGRPEQPPPGEEDAARKKLEEQIAKELAGGAAPGQPPAAASPQQGQPAPAQGGTGGNPMARLLLLPDISAIGSFAGAYDSYDVSGLSPRGEAPSGPAGKPTPLFQELELGLQSIVDPYARADVFISFAPEGVSVEEAYLTSLTLPAGLQVRAGKLFSPFGRQNQQHPHVWEFVDAPLALRRLLADEVLSGPGLDVAWLAPLPWFVEVHLAGQGTAPMPTPEGGEDPGERLTGVARLLQYFSFGDATTLGVGVSAARRSEATGAFRDLGAADLYLRWRPLGSRSYLALQGEGYVRKFRAGGMPEELRIALPVLAANAGRGADAGGYAQLFWRHGAYFGYGVRYDDAPWGPRFGAVDDAPSGRERRYGAVATWFPSEFQRLRLQLSYDRRPGGRDGLEALLALELGIGSHGAHPF